MTSLTAESSAPRALAVPSALVRLCRNAQKPLLGLRLGRLYGFGIGFSYAVASALGPASLGSSSKLWARCLGTVSWVAGIGALSLATDLAARDATQGLTGLVRLRGFGEPELERARTLAGALRLGTTVLVPGLMLSVASLVRYHTLPAALQALVLGLFTLPYAALVGSVLALLARLCQRALPGRGRLLFALVTLGPWLLALGLDTTIPNLPGAFGWLLEQLSRGFR